MAVGRSSRQLIHDVLYVAQENILSGGRREENKA